MMRLCCNPNWISGRRNSLSRLLASFGQTEDYGCCFANWIVLLFIAFSPASLLCLTLFLPSPVSLCPQHALSWSNQRRKKNMIGALFRPCLLRGRGGANFSTSIDACVHTRGRFLLLLIAYVCRVCSSCEMTSLFISTLNCENDCTELPKGKKIPLPLNSSFCLCIKSFTPWALWLWVIHTVSTPHDAMVLRGARGVDNGDTL